MPRLRNTVTGVIVNVRDGKTLDGYEPVKAETAKAPAAKKTAARPAKK